MNDDKASCSASSPSSFVDKIFSCETPEWLNSIEKWMIFFVEPIDKSLFRDYSPKVLIDSRVNRKTVKKKNFCDFLREEIKIQGRKWHIEYQSKDYLNQFVPLQPDSEQEDVDFGGAAIPTFLLCFEGTNDF